MSDEPDGDPLDLTALAPSARFIARLPAIGEEAARRAAAADLGARLTAAGRWFVPVAAAAVVLCWVVASGRAREAPPPRGAAVLGASSDAELARALMLAAGSEDR